MDGQKPTSQEIQKLHDKIVEDLEARLKNSEFFDEKMYGKVKTHYPYKINSENKKKEKKKKKKKKETEHGECDCFAIRKYIDKNLPYNRKALLLFEVKTKEKNVHIAKKQLRKDIRKFYTDDFYRVFTFFVFGMDDVKENCERVKQSLPPKYTVQIKWLTYKKRNDKTERFSKQ